MENDYVKEQIEASGPSGFSSEKAEKGILCQMLTKPDIASQYANTLRQNDFYDPDRGKLFAAIQATVVKRQNVDAVTVDNTIGEMFPADHLRLTDVMVDSISAMSLDFRAIDDYISIVKSLSQRRQSIIAFEAYLRDMKDPTKDIAEVISEMRQTASSVIEGRHKWESMSDVLMQTFQYLEKRERGEIVGITTGIGNVDRLVGGFFPGELTIIGARPSVGKSAFGANIAIEAAKGGHRVGVVSREMSNVQFGQRLLSRQSFVDGMKLRRAELDNDDWTLIAEALPELSVLPIDFMFTVSNVEDLRIEVQRKVERGELDMLIVDYLQLMRTQRRFDKDYLRVGYISAELKAMAVDFNIPVIALAQVNRDSDGQMPTLKSLKDSGSIEQDADGVIFLHRPMSANDPYVFPEDREGFEAYRAFNQTYLCIGVAKQRQGMVGSTSVIFDPAHMRYLEIDRTDRREPVNASSNRYGAAEG